MEGVCSGQALCPAEPGHGLARDALVPAEPMAAPLLPVASVIYGTGCCFAGLLPESGERCSLLQGAHSTRAGDSRGHGREQGQQGPSHLDLPLAKVEGFKEAQGDDLVNGCMIQLLPCGVGCFVSLISLFMPVGNRWAWEVAAGVSFAQLHLC